MTNEAVRKISSKFWTEEEDSVIKDLSKTAKEIALVLPNRTEQAAKNRRTLKKLSRTTPRTFWSDSEVEFLRENLQRTTYWIAKQLNRTYASVKTKRTKLDEKKYHCIECGVQIQNSGKYCSNHARLGRQVSYYKHRVSKGKGGDLTDDDINDLLKSDCEYCGEEVAMGIDRVDSSKGYFTDNVVPCCSKCNVMKMDADVDDWLAHMVKILEHNNAK